MVTVRCCSSSGIDAAHHHVQLPAEVLQAHSQLLADMAVTDTGPAPVAAAVPEAVVLQLDCGTPSVALCLRNFWRAALRGDTQQMLTCTWPWVEDVAPRAVLRPLDTLSPADHARLLRVLDQYQIHTALFITKTRVFNALELRVPGLSTPLEIAQRYAYAPWIVDRLLEYNTELLNKVPRKPRLPLPLGCRCSSVVAQRVAHFPFFMIFTEYEDDSYHSAHLVVRLASLPDLRTSDNDDVRRVGNLFTRMRGMLLNYEMPPAWGSGSDFLALAMPDMGLAVITEDVHVRFRPWKLRILDDVMDEDIQSDENADDYTPEDGVPEGELIPGGVAGLEKWLRENGFCDDVVDACVGKAHMIIAGGDGEVVFAKSPRMARYVMRKQVLIECGASSTWK